MPQTVIAFDFGEQRIGVAIGNTLTGAGRALSTIAESDAKRRFERIAALLAEWGPDRLVVGLPSHPDGAPHRMTLRCTRFANQLRGRFGLPVDLVDERYSSVDAAQEGGGRAGLDAQAARIILERYLSDHG